MKLNLGAGHHRLPGWVNVDQSPVSAPDVVLDLESAPWPWPDDSVGEVLLKHVLEHIGQQASVYLQFWCELWRVCRNGAIVHIHVPHPRSDDFLADPTHVRPVLPDGLALLSQKRNRRLIEGGFGNTPLGLQLGIDFDLLDWKYVPAPYYAKAISNGEMTVEELRAAGERWNNVYKEVRCVMRAVKPAGRVDAAIAGQPGGLGR